MPKFSTFITILIITLLVSSTGCNRPQGGGNQPPSDIGATQDADEGTQIPDAPADTAAPGDTQPAPTEEVPSSQPPTEAAPEIILEGDPILPLQPGASVDFKQVFMFNGLIGWGLATSDGRVNHLVRTEDGGGTWRDITPPQPDMPQKNWIYPQVHFNDPATGWVIFSDTDLVWLTKDGGISWLPVRLDFTAYLGGMIYSLDRNQVWLFQFIDGGMQKVNTALYRSDDGGYTWTKLLDPTMAPEYSIQSFDKTGVDFLDSEYGWLTRHFRGVSPDIRLDATHDGGSTWGAINLPAPSSAPNAFNECSCGLSHPDLDSSQAGSVMLECLCRAGESLFTKNYIYRTQDGGATWEIQSVPEGEFHKISSQVYYAVGREIYRTEDGGENWDLMKTVNWDGRFSFIDENSALGVAVDPEDEEYALVKTTTGCSTFQIIDPVILASQTIRD